MINEPDFTIGIEEEYLLVDLATGELVDAAPEGLIEDCDKAFPDQVHPELLQCQIEIGSRPRANMADLRQDLVDLRCIVAETAAGYGVGIIAASTHPWASWRTQRYTVQERYRLLGERMQAVMQRMTICGMHVHVGVEPDALRFDMFNQVSYILPHLLALVDLVTFPRRPRHRSEIVSYRALQRAAAHRLAGAVRKRVRLPARGRPAGGDRRHRGCQPYLVGHTPEHSASRPWRCAFPTCAHCSTTPSASPRCTAAGCACCGA